MKMMVFWFISVLPQVFYYLEAMRFSSPEIVALRFLSFQKQKGKFFQARLSVQVTKIYQHTHRHFRINAAWNTDGVGFGTDLKHVQDTSGVNSCMFYNLSAFCFFRSTLAKSKYSHFHIYSAVHQKLCMSSNVHAHPVLKIPFDLVSVFESSIW